MLNTRRNLVHKQVKHTLLVVDLQDRFVGSPVRPDFEICVKKTIQEVVAAKRRNDHVILLECDYYSPEAQKTTWGKKPCQAPSIQKLNDLVKNYQKSIYVYKMGQDGGSEVFKTLVAKKIPRSNIRVCGVYAEYCVHDTVQSLRRMLPRSKLHLVKDGIQSSRGEEGKASAFSKMTFYPNVSVIG